MLRRCLAVAVATAGIVFIGRGWVQSTDHEAARRTAFAFLEAVRRGDSALAQGLMQHPAGQDGGLRASGLDWSPDTATRITSLDVRPSESGMVAEAELERSGFTITPTLHLERSDGGVWLVSHVSGLGVDRDWVDVIEAKLTAEDRAVTEELRIRIGGLRRDMERR